MEKFLTGIYNNDNGEGIFSFQMKDNGQLKLTNSYIINNPSYIIKSRKNNHIYTVTENGSGDGLSFVTAFSIFSDSLSETGRSYSGQNGITFIAEDIRSEFLVTANYGSGSISVFCIEENGTISNEKQIIKFTGHGTYPERQEQPHIHCIVFTPDGEYVFATDLGTDHIYRYELDYSNKEKFINEQSLKKYKMKNGAGPRHMCFHPDGKKVFLINELDCSIISFIYSNGELLQTAEYTANREWKDADGGALKISPDGKKIYTSFRNYNDGVAEFNIEDFNGRLSLRNYIRTGSHPRDINISSDGKFLFVASMNDNEIEIFKIKDTYRSADRFAKIQLNSPACICLL
ncbi:MAG: lactonase family protein [Rikenellaceae bacterium]|nr:lactonase family protein [Rikenellaceae bacterium]